MYDYNDNEIFWTTELMLAAYLNTQKIDLLATKVQKGTRGEIMAFGFRDDQMTQSLVKDFNQGAARVEPKQFYYEVQSLRSRIYQEIRKNN